MKSLAALALLLATALPAVKSRAAEEALAVLRAHCARCHGDGVARGGFGRVLDRDRLVAGGKVVPGRPEESELYQRVRDGEMPPAKEPRPTPGQVVLLRQWIEAGAPGVPSPAGPRTFIADAEVLRLIRADLDAMEPHRRRFVRYLTLTHLYNAGRPEEELQAGRLAVAKLVNSLSWHPRVSVPEAIDPNRTILRLDLRHYQWTARLWDRLQAVYPYRRDTGAVAAATGCALPVVRADWFVAVASRPPLYHDFLQLPGSDRELERLLRVDVLNDLQEETAVRAGFNGSGVSRNNRLIERHDAAYGAYWRSYDFSDNVDRQNLFEHPLGPVPGQNSFVHAGGELIFHLPNGLQGYLLVDGNGRRLDRAPADIVSDPRRPDHAVETGRSCMTCHSRGLILKPDQVRDHVRKNAQAFTPDELATVLALYPPAARLRALMRSDSQRFTAALTRVGVRPEDAEPIGAVAERYEAALDLAAAAAELGLPAEEFAHRLRGSPTLARVLGSLRTGGGTVQRSTFEAAFPDAARVLAPGAEGPAVGKGSDVVRPFCGHSGSVSCVAFSADGRLAVSGGADGTARVWDVVTGSQRQCLRGHAEEVLAVAASADGARVVSGGRDTTVRLWDVAAGRELHHLAGHTDRVSAVACTPDGRHILSGSWDHTVRLWDAATGAEVLRLTGHTGRVLSVAFSPDGTRALSGGQDGSSVVWDLRSGREVRRLDGPPREVYAVAWSPDGRRALTGGNDGTARLWDVATGHELRRFSGHPGTVIAVAFSADGRRVLSGCSQYRGAEPALGVWDADTGAELHRLGAAGVWSAAFTSPGNLAITGTSQGVLRLWKLAP